MTETIEEKTERRTDKIKRIFTGKLWIILLFTVVLILGIYLRVLPMTLHGVNPGLWDITTNTWTLGPDLDPWLFYRYAETIVEQGSLPAIDMMRNIPLGFDTSTETKVLPYMIVGTYYFLSFLSSDATVMYAAVIFPVIMFALTIIVFFLFAREIFIGKNKENKLKANLIALISTFFFVTLPPMLQRTIAGIPEKESAAFFFMILAFYLFLKAWKSENYKKYIPFAILAGISTGLMALIWYGVIYVFVAISLSYFFVFIFGKVHKKEFIIYALWFIIALLMMVYGTGRYSLYSVVNSIYIGIPFLILILLIVHFSLSKIKFIQNIKFPQTLLSLIITIILIIILTSIFLGPGFLLGKVKTVNEMLFKPITGRWSMTVAENRQPFFKEWVGNFPPFLKGFSIYFLLFFAGSILFFKEMFNKIKKKDTWILMGLYILAFIGIVYTRYSASSIFNGTNFISKGFYFLSLFLFFGALVYFHLKYYKKGDFSFSKIKFEYFFLFILFILTLIAARGIIRLVMVLAITSPIMVGYLCVTLPYKYRNSKIEDTTLKIIALACIISVLLLGVFAFYSSYKITKQQSYNMVPSYYNQQWQKGMGWVRENTAEDSVFGFWWDYGYWAQGLAHRSTVLDGGNTISYWNYLMGRLVLTGDNQDDALEFLYNHNVTHFLIDSTDIGKYSAFSIIGSDLYYDRFSWIGTFTLDRAQTQETKNQTLLFYLGGTSLDEDLIIEENEKEVFLPAQHAGIGAIILPMSENEFQQPHIIIVYQEIQHKVDLRYLYLDGKFIDFGSGIEACAYVFPRIIQTGGGINSELIGSAMYLSPRLMRGMFTQIYLLEDPFNNFPNFELVHTQHSIIIEELNRQGMNLPEFVHFQGIQGPIKIWEINYTGNEEIKEEYLDTWYSDYIDWKL